MNASVQAICNCNLKFENMVARWPGSSHDATIFNNSVVRRQFENGLFPNSLLVGDSGYPIKPYLLTPLLNPVTPAQQLYNEVHIRTRNTTERTFGVWKRRFSILAYGCRLKLETLTVITACAVLHNICREHNEEEPPHPDDLEQFQQLMTKDEIPYINVENDEIGGAGFDERNNLNDE